jgi:hypothetical protein
MEGITVALGFAAAPPIEAKTNFRRGNVNIREKISSLFVSYLSSNFRLYVLP